MLEIQDIKNPRWANKEHTLLDADVKFAEFDDYLDYTSSATDRPSQHVYLAITSGKYGEIAEYIGPEYIGPEIIELPEVTKEEIEARLKKVTKVQEV